MLFPDYAWAMGTSGPAEGGQNPILSFLPIIIIFVIFYFLLIRPQQKRQKEHQAMINNIKRGDKVVTSGGIYGLVESVGEKTLTLKIAENTKVKFQKHHITEVREKEEEE